MKIISWNCQGLRAKVTNLQAIIHIHQPDIIFLQETQLNPMDKFYKIKGYTEYFKSRPTSTRGHGGVAILIKPNIPHKEIVIQSSIQCTIVKASTPTPITLCSIYLSNEDWRTLNTIELKNLLTSLPNPKIIAGDLNARNTLWHSDITCHRGRLLERIFDEEDLLVIDEDVATHI